MPALKVLVVEDEFLIRLTLSEALQDDGYDVLEASSADEAVEQIQSGQGIDLLMTDVQLPGKLNGWQLVEMARKSHPDLPVIFMTGRPDSVPTPVGPREMVVAKPYLPSDICAAARRMTAHL